MTLRALIVDDERLARVELRTLLADHPSITIVGEAADVESAKTALVTARPDLVFLDIALGAGSGFDLLESIDRRCRIVFVTAFDAHAVRAFEVQAVDYLLKPVHPDRLVAAIARLERQEPFVYLTCGDGGTFVPVGAIVCILAEGDYTRLVTTDGQEHIVLRSLSAWERRLPDDTFVRIHRSAIANLSLTTKTRRGRDGRWRLYVQGLARPLVISRRRRGRVS